MECQGARPQVPRLPSSVPAPLVVAVDDPGLPVASSAEGDFAVIPLDVPLDPDETMVAGPNGGLSHVKVDGSSPATMHLLYREVADGSGVVKGHFDLLLWPDCGWKQFCQ